MVKSDDVTRTFIASRASLIQRKNRRKLGQIKHEVDTAAKQTIDVLKGQHHLWFDDSDAEIQGLPAEKYAAHKNWLTDKQSDSKRHKVHHLRRKFHKQLLSMKDKWLKKKAHELQGYADFKECQAILL